MAGIPTESPLVLRESLGSSHNRLTSAEDYEEALLSGYPPVGLLDAKNVYHAEQKGNRRGLRSPWGQIYGTIATTVPGGVLQRLQHPNFANPGVGASSPGSFGKEVSNTIAPVLGMIRAGRAIHNSL